MELSTLMLVALVSLMVAMYWLKSRRKGYLERLGVPVVAPVLFFGSPPFNWHQIVFHKYFTEMHEKLGKTWAMFMGSTATIVTIDADIIKEVTIKQFDCFTDTTEVRPPDRQNTLDLAHGETWRSLRKLLSPTFTSGKLRAMFGPISEVADMMLERLGALNEEAVNAKPLFETTTLEITARCAFGISIDSGGNEGDSEILKFGREVFEAFRVTSWSETVYTNLTFLFPVIISWFSIYGPAFDQLFSITRTIIDSRDRENRRYNDFLDRLRDIRKGKDADDSSLNDDIILAQGVIFFLAGYETTSSSMSSFCHSMAVHPDVQERVYQDILQHDGDISEMHLLEAAINENLRLHGPATENNRMCVKDCVVQGMHITKGTYIMMPTYASHLHPDYFTDPQEFRPERFLPENASQLIPLTWRPFGVGPRNCIGQRFAMAVMKICLSKLMTRFIIKAEPGSVLTPSKGYLFMCSYEPVKLRFVPRA